VVQLTPQESALNAGQDQLVARGLVLGLGSITTARIQKVELLF
jgi:hypothetical protein